MQSKLLYILTRTPLHVGAGSSVGAVDQPIQRERHTGFPIIPGSSLKGVFRDLWGGKNSDSDRLFGASDANSPGDAFAGSVQFGEARLLVFPVRSAKGCFAWITSPLILNRYFREIGGATSSIIGPAADDEVLVTPQSEIVTNNSVVLEEYAFRAKSEFREEWVGLLEKILPEDSVWSELGKHLVMVKDDTMAHFALTACEVAQHVSILDQTGTAKQGGLFNQENVPSETLFYAPVYFHSERKGKNSDVSDSRDTDSVEQVFRERLTANPTMQFGADASTGLGFCSVRLNG